MFLCFLPLMIFFNFLLTNVKCSVISYAMERGKRDPVRKIRQFSEEGEDWMKEVLKVNEELLSIQAIIAKDEESSSSCMTGSRKTHNLRAPLVVVLGPLKSTPQVIRVDSYRVHPNHIVFPYNNLHTKHNIAVIRLSCSIAAEHFTPIQMPEAPYTEVCSSDNCLVAIIRRVGKTSLVLYETRAKHISNTRKRRSIEMATELKNYSIMETPSANIQEKLGEILETPHPLLFLPTEAQEIFPNNVTQDEIDFSTIEFPNRKKIRNLKSQKEGDSLDLENNLEDIPFEKLGSLMSGKINSEDMSFEKLGTFISGNKTNSSSSSNKVVSEEKKESRSLEVITTTTSIADQYVFQGDSDRNYKVRLFSVRASDGFQGCPQSGSPVMFGQVQAALVSISCDDRQPGIPWKYTDLFINANWIKEVIKNWLNETKSDNVSRSNATGCSTCIYNFFIDLTASKENCANLDENSTKHKLCASHAKRRLSKNEFSTPGKNNLRSINSPHLANFNNKKKPTTHDIRPKTMNKVNYPQNNKGNPKSSKITSKFPRTDSVINLGGKEDLEKYRIEDKEHNNKVYRQVLKNVGQDSSKEFGEDVGKDNDRDSGRILKMDFDQDFDKDFEKKFQVEFQKDLNKDLNKEIYRDYDGSIKRKLKKDYYLRNTEIQNGNRLKKQVEIDQRQKVLKRNEHRDLNSFKARMMNPLQSTEYNSLTKKFHNLGLELARVQKSIPEKDVQKSISEKNDQKLVIGGPGKILPNKEFPNSGQEMKHIKEERVQPMMDRQFAVLFRDKEMGVANNHHNVFPGFNGYFL